MELRKLRYFVVLAEELHFGRAAQRLHITQPPLSTAIQALEEELRVPLFTRSPRRVALTHAGTAFLEQARALLARTDDAIELARAADRGEVGRLTIGFMSASIYTLLPPVLRDFAARFPAVKLDLREMAMPEQLAALRAGDIDVGVVRPPVDDPELSSETLLREALVVALPRGHRLAKLRRIPGRRLAEEPFVMFRHVPGLVLHDFVLRFCHQLGFSPRVAQEATQSHAVVGLVSAGIGVALVPASIQTTRLRGVEYRPLQEKSPPVLTVLAWRRDDPSPVVAAFRKTAQEIATRAEKELGGR
ncbi:MAG TPA: LysR family transcriptional regulator [Burkholderiaceae bacterium]|nr:LysR family transcriptional regulator [Burkholderiaceae bacterium]